MSQHQIMLPLGTGPVMAAYTIPKDRPHQVAALLALIAEDHLVGLILPADADILVSMRRAWTIPAWTRSRTVRVYTISPSGAVQLLAESKSVRLPEPSCN